MADLSVLTDGPVPDEGTYIFTATDSEGCVGDTTWTVTILELPQFGDLTVVPNAIALELNFHWNSAASASTTALTLQMPRSLGLPQFRTHRAM